MTDHQHFNPNIPARAKVRLLGADGEWAEAGQATDYRRVWIDLAESIRTFGTPEEDLKKILMGVLNLPIDKELRHAALDTVADALLDVVYQPGVARENWARQIALILEGLPDFDVPRFMHHATSDDPDGKWSYQVAHPEGEWSRDPESPEDCLKIDVAPE
jgi:hypothetical protein